MKTTYFFRIALLALVVGVGSGCKESEPSGPISTPPEDPSGPGLGVIPITFPSMNVPSSNPSSAAKIELGRHLFYDKRLSVDQTVSCATCHNPAAGFADPQNRKVTPGVFGRKGKRNAMTLVNLGHYEDYVWNGRFKTLEEHAPGPIFNHVEMGFGGDDRNNDGYGDPDDDTIILFRNLDKEIKYKALFRNAFGDETITIDRMAKALASFERTFVSNTSPFDRYNRGDEKALNEHAVRGYKLFTDTKKTNCLNCHNGPNFTDGLFHSNGASGTTDDRGRGELTGNSVDLGKFRTPSLRNAGVTRPYMHDGSIDDLEGVIRQYVKGGDGRDNQDPRIVPLALSDQDIADLAAFIQSLTDTQFMSNPALQDPWHKD